MRKIILSLISTVAISFGAEGHNKDIDELYSKLNLKNTNITNLKSLSTNQIESTILPMLLFTSKKLLDKETLVSEYPLINSLAEANNLYYINKRTKSKFVGVANLVFYMANKLEYSKDKINVILENNFYGKGTRPLEIVADIDNDGRNEVLLNWQMMSDVAGDFSIIDEVNGEIVNIRSKEEFRCPKGQFSFDASNKTIIFTAKTREIYEGYEKNKSNELVDKYKKKIFIAKFKYDGSNISLAQNIISKDIDLRKAVREKKDK